MMPFSQKAITNPAKFMLSLVEQFPNQIRESRKQCSNILLKKAFKEVYFFGMGGSGITGDILKEYLKREHKIRAYSFHDYKGPEWMDKDSLAVILSYSGNTEEAIASYNSVRKKGCEILVMSSNGKLKKIAKRDNITFIELPKGMPPRSTVGLMFFSILKILENSGIIPEQDNEVKKTIEVLSSSNIKENGKILVDKINGKTPLIYASPHFAPIAYRWKTQFNENAKKFAFWNYFPELNHNELEVFSSPQPEYHVIILSDEKDSTVLKRRIEITKRYITRGSSLTHILLKGNSYLTKIFYAIALGDFASIYQAIRDNKNPLPVNFIEEFKKELSSLKKQKE